MSAALAAACDGGTGPTRQTDTAPPAGWRETVVLPGGDSRDAVVAALPENLAKSAEAGIENQISSFSAPGLLVRFDYGATAHPGCEQGASRCQVEDRTIGGREGKATISSSRETGFSTSHDYFVRDENAPPSGSTAGSGLHISIKCAEAPRCGLSETIVENIRFRRHRGG